MMLYNPEKLLLITGPCSLENKAVCNAVATCLFELKQTYPELNIIFKGSFDKANRTSITSQRGPGLSTGIELLQFIKDEYGFPVVTDIHTAEQAEVVGKVCDVIQIPAFLCRQTDLLLAASKTKKTVFVKKGQFLSPHEMNYVVTKLAESNAKEIWQGERGTFFGYNNLVVDMRSFAVMKANGHPTIFDATHSVQEPGNASGQSGGRREFVLPLICAALGAGADGLFIEAHPNPEKAISDAASQVPLSEFPRIVEKALQYWKVRHSTLSLVSI